MKTVVGVVAGLAFFCGAVRTQAVKPGSPAEAALDAVHRAAVIASTRVSAARTPDGLDEADESLQVEVKLARAKVKTAREKELLGAFAEAQQKLHALLFQWKLELENARDLAAFERKADQIGGRKPEDPEIARLQAEMSARSAVKEKIADALKALDDASERYASGDKPNKRGAPSPVRG